MKPFTPLSLLALSLPLLSACTASTTEPPDDSSSPATESSDAAKKTPILDAILSDLRANPQAALVKHSTQSGFPAPVEGGFLFVSTDPKLPNVAGDHDSWTGTLMKKDAGFFWVVLPVAVGDRYKLTDKRTFAADPWARSYTYDSFGEISLVKPKDAHLDRFIGIGDASLPPRPLHIWVPKEPVTHVLYVQDGQNLFDPNASFGSWNLQASALPGMLMVGIDNTAGRMDEYTHVPDVIDGVSQVGGKGDAYASFLKNTVRPLIRARYGEPGPVGVMGSSLGGLISLHIADHDPGAYAFAASLSGTMGWGSIGTGIHNPTMIERYKAHGHKSTVLYIDSGGSGTCFDSDGDGINDDDANAHDNFCENSQLRDTLIAAGYTPNQDLYHWWEPGAEHNEAAWGARVFRPLALFKGL